MTLPGFTDLSKKARDRLTDPAFVQQFLAGLRRHEQDNPVKSKKIEKAMALTGPDVRAIISHFRNGGYPICSSGKGYFWTDDAGVLQQTIDHLRSRARAEIITATAMERTQSALRCGGEIQERLL